MQISLSEHFNYRKLLRFTLPTMIMMIVTSIYGVVDGLFISNVVGDKPFAAVNLIWPFIMMLGTVGFMIGTGGSALVSKTLGEGNRERANQYFSILIYILIISGIIVSIFGIIFIEPISILLKADEVMLEYCKIYGRTLLIFLPAFMLQNSFQSFLIVAEKPQFGLRISIAAGVTNMLLDFLCIYVFNMGVFGAALATGISQFVGASIPVYYFIVKNDFAIKLVRTRLELKPILQACWNGSSEMVSNISFSLVNMIFNGKLMELVGSDGVVAYGIIMYVGFIFVGVYIGYAVGTAPIIGFHYGAKNEGELKSILSKSIKLLAFLSIVLTELAELFAGFLALIFVKDNLELLQMTTHAIRLYSLVYLINSFCIFISSFFTALNNGFVSAFISFVRTIIFQISTICIMSAIWGVNGLWLSAAVADLMSLCVAIVCLFINRKKYNYM